MRVVGRPVGSGRVRHSAHRLAFLAAAPSLPFRPAGEFLSAEPGREPLLLFVSVAFLVACTRSASAWNS